MQQMMGVDEPDYGHLLDEMQVFEHIPVRAAKYLYPRVEVEVGFILAADLPGAQCSEDDVLGATAALVPAIELIDTRITDWNIALCDTIADNASSAGFVLGEARVSPAEVDVTGIEAVLARNGEVVAKGRSDAVLGNPVTAVAWLARKVESFGVRLREGDIVLPGSCTRAVDARPAIRSSRSSTAWGRCGCLSNRAFESEERSCRPKLQSPSSGRATSAPTCFTSCCARSGWSRAGWWASTRTARAWRGLASWGWKPPPRAWTGCWPSPTNRTCCSRPPAPTCTRRRRRNTPRPGSGPSI
ncbi:fumarylacetoacetate (FAA) hydrolase family protein [Mycobacterium xenopi 3993]|nr:fumarylacetoacetate (FAA) hydrolase family protein [Mycobacterium xenopi 3993]